MGLTDIHQAGTRSYGKSTIFALLLLAISLPTLYNLLIFTALDPLAQKYTPLQKFLHNKTIKPLAGEYIKAERPPFSWKSWFSGDFQKQFEFYIEHNIGFRNFFVRAKNQFDYTVFRVSNNSTIVVGINGYLYENVYIDAYLGRDFAGQAALDKTVSEAKALQEALQAININFIIVLAPGKASFYPEFIPAQYSASAKRPTNYEYLIARFRQEGIHHLDLRAEFLAMKQSAPHQLYPKCGIHWSIYGSTLAAMSLKTYMEQIGHIRLRDMSWTNVVVTTTPRGADNDLGELMNLLQDLPQEPMAYPEVMYSDDPGISKPRILVIGDSYYWNICFWNHLFSAEEFWYYNSSIYKNGQRTPLKVSQIDLKETVKNQNFVIVLDTEPCFANLGQGFITQAYQAFIKNNRCSP